jgi:hypothetical protein
MEERMKSRNLLVLASFLMACAFAAPVAAGVTPYVRLDWGGTGLKMTDENNLIRETEASLQAAGYPAAFKTIGTGYGPSAALGLWIVPGVRIGATYSYLKAIRHNNYSNYSNYSYADDLDFRMNEIGVEAAVRSVKLAGLTVGANVARGRAELIERRVRVVEHELSQYSDATANRTETTYGGFVGFDRTSLRGVAGFIRAGYQYRDIGRVPSHLTTFDGTSIVHSTGRTGWLDYSGFYVKFGVGYDLVR